MKTKKEKAELFTIDQLRQAFITGGKAGYNSAIGKDFLTFDDYLELIKQKNKIKSYENN